MGSNTVGTITRVGAGIFTAGASELLQPKPFQNVGTSQDRANLKGSLASLVLGPTATLAVGAAAQAKGAMAAPAPPTPPAPPTTDSPAVQDVAAQTTQARLRRAGYRATILSTLTPAQKTIGRDTMGS